MEVLDTCVKGLTVMYTDYGVTYKKRKSKGKEFSVEGEWDSGEAWVNGEHLTYVRSIGNGQVVLRTVEDGIEVYRFEDSERGWALFADSVL